MSEPRRAGGRVAQQAETDGQTKPASPADSAMPAKPAERAKPLPSGEADGDWRGAPHQVCAGGRDLVGGPSAAGRGEGGGGVFSLLVFGAGPVRLARPLMCWTPE